MRKLSFVALIIIMLFTACNSDLTNETFLFSVDTSEKIIEAARNNANAETDVTESKTITEPQTEKTTKTYPWDNKEFQYDWQKTYFKSCGNFDTLIWNYKTGEVKNIDSSEIFDIFGNYTFSDDWSLGILDKMYIGDFLLKVKPILKNK